MFNVRNLQRNIIAVSAMLGLALIFVIPKSLLVSKSQENYTLDFVMESYEAGQVRAIITSGTDLFVSSDGAYIFAQSDGIYRVSDGEFLGEYPDARFSPDGTHFTQPGIGVYRLEDMSIRFATPHPVAFSLDGEYFAIDTDGVYRLSELTRVVHIPDATFTFSEDGKLVATSEGRVYHLLDPNRVVEVPGIRDGVIPFISPDGRFAWARNATLIHVDSGAIVSPTLNVTRFTPDGHWAIVYGIGIFNLLNDSQTSVIDLDGIENISVSPLGRYFTTPQGVFRLSDGEQLIDTRHLNLPEFTFAPDDTTVVIRRDGLYNLEPTRMLHELQGFGDYHANGRYVSTNDRIVRTTDGNIVFESRDERLSTLMISPDESLVAFIRDGVYNLMTGEKLFSIDGLMDTFSVDSAYLAVRGREETAIYRTSDGRRYEGLEPLYTERGLLSVGSVVFVVDSTKQGQQLPFIRVTPEQQFLESPESGSETFPLSLDGVYLTVLETVPGWVRVEHGGRDLWTQVSPDNILRLPS